MAKIRRLDVGSVRPNLQEATRAKNCIQNNTLVVGCCRMGTQDGRNAFK